MNNQEEKEIYEIDNRKYIVTTRVIENAQSLNNLYEAFSKYALRKLNTTI
jgi:hypothetical protein